MTSRFEKYLGKGENIKIGDEEVELKPLDVEYLPHFFKIFKSMQNPERGIFDEECTKSVVVIIEETLKRSLPDESEAIRKQIGLKYSNQLIEVIFRMNRAEGAVDDKKAKQIDAIKQMIKKDG